MKIKNQILCILISIVLVISVLPTTVLAANMTVYAITPANETLSLDVKSADSVENIKQLIQDKKGLSASKMLLFFGSMLLEEGRTLEDYNIQNGATIEIVLIKNYLALGDSISTGYGLNDKSTEAFPVLVAGENYVLDNDAVDGYTTTDLLAYLGDTKNNKAVSDADIITVTIGGNDMMQILYSYLAEEIGTYDNQTLTADKVEELLATKSLSFVSVVAEVINNGTFAIDDETFSSIFNNLYAIVSKIKQLNSNAKIIIATQYNPYSELAADMENMLKQSSNILEAFKDLANAVIKLEDDIDKALAVLNAYIKNTLEADCLVVDVYTAFSESETGPLCNAGRNGLAVDLDIHPNATGHKLIADTIREILIKAESKSYIVVDGVTLYPGDYLAEGEDIASKTAPADNYAQFQSDGKTLVLSNFTARSSKTIISENSLDITLKGVNSFDSVYMSYTAGIKVNGHLKIGGQGSLVVVGGMSTGDSSSAIYASGDIVFKDGVIIKAAAVHVGVRAGNSITITGGAKVTADGGQNAIAQGYCVRSKTVNIEDGTLILVTDGVDGNDQLWASETSFTGYKYYRTSGGYVEGAYSGGNSKVKYLELTTTLPVFGSIVISGISIDCGQYLEQGKNTPVNGIPNVESYAWYDPNASVPTLVLHNFSVSTSGVTSYAIATSEDSLTIRLEGSSSVRSSSGMGIRVMRTNPYSSGALTITGNGSLSIDEVGEKGYAIYAATGVTIKGGAQVTISAPNGTCINNANFKIEDVGTRLISSGQSCILSNNSNIYVTLPEAYQYRTSTNGELVNSSTTKLVPDANLKYVEIIVVELIKHAHEWSDEWTSDNSAHWHECESQDCTVSVNTEKDGYETHFAPAGNSDCTKDVKCPVCLYVFTEAKDEHSFTTRISSQIADPGDCQTKVKYKAMCDNCDVISDSVTVEVNEYGDHTWDSDWSFDDNDHWHKCLIGGCLEMKDNNYHFSTGINSATYTKKAI